MPVKTRRKSLTPAEKAAYRAEKSDRVAQLSEDLKAFAESTDADQRAVYEARFDYYSPRNAMLIVMQAPDATVVRGFKAWLAEGRCVRKGEHSYITILSPAGSTGGKSDDEAATQAQPGEVFASKERRFFRPTAVFDISQTEPIESA